MERLKFRVKPSFILFCLLLLFVGKLQIFTFYIVSVLIHELTHYFVAQKYFYRCDRIELSIFGCVLYGDFEEAIGKEQMYIALSAPLLNLALALLLIALWYIFPSFYVYTMEFMYANLSMGLINLLPCYPLDGGKVLIGILTTRYGYAQSLIVSKALSLVFAVILFVVFVCTFSISIFSFYLAIFSLFLVLSTFGTTKSKIFSKLQSLLPTKKRLAYGIERHVLVFSTNSTLGQAGKKLDANNIYTIELVDEDYNLVATLDEKTFRSYLMKYSYNTKFCEVI